MPENALQAKIRELDELQSDPTISTEEFIEKVEAELKPLIEQEIRAHGAHDPDWKPLEKALPYKWCAGFMFMGYEGEIRIYKHGFTRACLYLDPHGDTYAREGREWKRIDRDDAIEAVFEGIEAFGFTRSTPYNRANAKKRRDILEKETGIQIVNIGGPT